MPPKAAPADKLPASDLPIIRDPELARAVNLELQHLEGKKLAAAQAAVRAVSASNLQGSFAMIASAYTNAVREAVAKARD